MKTNPEINEERIKALKAYNILHKIPDQGFDNIIEIASLLSNAPIAFISLVDEEKQLIRSKKGLSFTESPLEESICQYTIKNKQPLIIKNIKADSRFCGTVLPPGLEEAKFYAGFPLISAEGYILGALCIMDNKTRNLTVRQQEGLTLLAKQVVTLIINAREKLELLQLQRLFQLSNDLIRVSKKDGTILRVNPAGERILGWTAKEQINKNLLNFVHPEDVERIQQSINEISAANLAINRTYRAIAKDHTIKVLEWVGSYDPVSESIYAIGRDITAIEKESQKLEESEKKLRILFEHSQTFICLHKLNGDFISVNKAGAQALNYKPEELLGASLFAIVPRHRHEVLQNYLKEIAQNGHHKGVMQTITKNDEIKIWIYDNALIDNGEEEPYVIGNAVDVTERIRLEGALKIAKEIAEQATKAKSEFLANMSHEIRTPLNGVIGFTDLVLKTELTKTQRKYISIVNESANSLLFILNDILDFSKIEAGKLEIITAQCDLFELASQAINIISYHSESKALEVTLHRSPDLPRFIWIDDMRLKQILINLLSNAVKFTEKGSVQLNISLMETMEENKSKLRFEVIDTGIGIKAGKQEKIFEAFEQEDGEISKKYGGTGLGLTISNKLLKLMGSQMHLSSKTGKGSKFYFDLVVRSENTAPIEFETLGNIRRVLLVDDSENNLMLIKEMLQLKNIETVVAKTGIEAIQNLYNGERYDVILVDYLMPIMDGPETIKKIKENFYPDTDDAENIILYSALEDEALQKACKELKINHMMMKPVKITELYDLLVRIGKKEPASRPEPEKGLSPEVSSIGNGTKINILIAEDNQTNMLLTKTLVRRILPKAQIHEAHNGQEAVNKALKMLFDVILMDIQMPKLNGMEATRVIRENLRDKHVPIIALTAGNMKGDKEKCLAAGVDDFINKPLQEKPLKDILEKWITKAEEIEEGHHIDFKIINSYVLDDREFEKTFLSMTIRAVKEGLQDLKKHIREKDLIGIKACAHKLRGTTSTTGLIFLNHLVLQLEKIETWNQEPIDQLGVKIEKEIMTIVSILSSKL